MGLRKSYETCSESAKKTSQWCLLRLLVSLSLTLNIFHKFWVIPLKKFNRKMFTRKLNVLVTFCRTPAIHMSVVLRNSEQKQPSGSNRIIPPKVFLGKSVPKICCKFTRKHPCRKVISIKLLIFVNVDCLLKNNWSRCFLMKLYTALFSYYFNNVF